ncbi:MAG TPA: DNA-deoxyinosine glycosylase [Rectinemataceae bacterium]|nr:DNA-deoxyinosine glycosylase [Rectinemataceae bacterium]
MSENAPLEGFPPAGAVGEGEEPLFLILGSFPSVRSLEKREYYGNPRNHFWKIICDCFGRPEPYSYEGKIEMLKKARIALWDVFASCERPGSLDKDISRVQPNPIVEFLRRRPSIVAIGANGGAAAQGFAIEIIGSKPRRAGESFSRTGQCLDWTPGFAPGRRIRVTRLPSSSPVPTAAFKTAADKMPVWKLFFTIQM